MFILSYILDGLFTDLVEVNVENSILRFNLVKNLIQLKTEINDVKRYNVDANVKDEFVYLNNCNGRNFWLSY